MAKSNGIRDVAGVQRREAYMIDPAVIEIEDGFNARNFKSVVNQQRIESLYASIKEVGVQTPVIVRYESAKDGTQRIILVDGETRLRATLRAISEGSAIAAIPAITETTKSSEADRTASLISRNDSARLQPLEQGEVFSRLLAFGWSEAEISRKTGANPATVNQYLKLYTSPEAIKKMVEDELLSATYALEVLAEEGEDPEKVIARLTAELAEAKAQGKAKATKRFSKKEQESKSEPPLYYQRTMVKTFIDELVKIAVDTAFDSRWRRGIKDVLENAGVDWSSWEVAE